jgi:hypothetical protein
LIPWMFKNVLRKKITNIKIDEPCQI